MSTIASAVAASEGSTPKVPVRRTRTRSPIALTSVTIRPSRSAISSKSTCSSGDWLSVSCTIAIEPTRRTASSSAALASGASIRRAWSRSSAATVWRLFFTRWWISRMVASLVTSSRSRRRRSVTSRSRISAPIRSPSGRSGIDAHDERPRRRCRPRCRGVPGRSSTALSVSSSVRCRGGTSARVNDGQLEPGEVAAVPEPAVDRQRVGAGVGNPPVGVDAQEPVADPRRVGVVAALAGVGEVARRRSSGSGRRRSGGRTAPGGWGCGPPAGWCCGRPRRSTRSARRTGIASTRTGTSSRHSGSPSRTSRPASYAASSSGRRPAGTKVPSDVVDQRGRAGGRAHLPGRPEPPAVAVGQPQHQVGEGEVGDDLPVRHQQLEPRRRPRRRGRCGCAPGRSGTARGTGLGRPAGRRAGRSPSVRLGPDAMAGWPA